MHDFFWEIGEYVVLITIDYDQKRSRSFSFGFLVTEQASGELRRNVDESLVAQLKAYHNIAHAFSAPVVELYYEEPS